MLRSAVLVVATLTLPALAAAAPTMFECGNTVYGPGYNPLTKTAVLAPGQRLFFGILEARGEPLLFEDAASAPIDWRISDYTDWTLGATWMNGTDTAPALHFLTGAYDGLCFEVFNHGSDVVVVQTLLEWQNHPPCVPCIV